VIATGVYLAVPGLLGPLPAGLTVHAASPALQALLVKAAPSAAIRGLTDQSVVSARAIAGLLDPADPLSVRLTGADRVLAVTPLNLIPDRDTLLALDAATLTLSMDEAVELCADLNTLFRDDRLVFAAVAPTLWVVGLPAGRPVPAGLLPAEQVSGRRFAEVLPSGPGARAWIRWLNELQMALHGSRCSVGRAAAGRSRVTGAWVWGAEDEGRCAARTLPWALLCTDAPLLRALAQQADCLWRPAPPDPESLLQIWEEQARGASTAPAVYAGLAAAPAVSDGRGFADWERWLAAFDRDWLGPLHRALASGRIPALGLADGRGREWLCRRRDRYRLWLRPRRLSALFEEERTP
jgi:hypothetical protein